MRPKLYLSILLVLLSTISLATKVMETPLPHSMFGTLLGDLNSPDTQKRCEAAVNILKVEMAPQEHTVVWARLEAMAKEGVRCWNGLKGPLVPLLPIAPEGLDAADLAMDDPTVRSDGERLFNVAACERPMSKRERTSLKRRLQRISTDYAEWMEGDQTIGAALKCLERAGEEIEVADRGLVLGSPATKKGQNSCAIIVDSDPRGALLSVNGAERGVTPAKFAIPCDQVADIALTLEGYEPVSQRVSPRRESEVQVTLTRIPVRALSLTVDKNVKIYVDGRFVREASANVSFRLPLRVERKYRIRFKNEIFGIDTERDFVLHEDKVVIEHVRLTSHQVPSKK